MKPLFIPLKARFFDAFERGEKDTEYRLLGPRWNHKTCVAGRAVVLSMGYGKSRRLTGRIVFHQVDRFPQRHIAGWRECYGDCDGAAICIKIQLDMKPKRIQLKRTKGWRMPPNTVKVDRSTRWGNMFRVTKARTAYQARDEFAAMLETGGLGQLNGENIRRELRGKNLACWCNPGEPCHADVLLEVANS